MRAIAVFVFLLPISFLSAQIFDPTNPSQRAIDTSFSSVDTAVAIRNGILDVFEGNPGTAAIRGLMIPAGGQIYNKRWWKVPLALGLEGATIGYLIYTYDRFSIYDQEYRTVIGGGPHNPSLSNGNLDLILRTRNALRTDREMAWVFFAVGHIFTAFEAYIDRHLSEFDVSDDLTFTPIIGPWGVSPTVTYSIPLHTTRFKSTRRLLTYP